MMFLNVHLLMAALPSSSRLRALDAISGEVSLLRAIGLTPLVTDSGRGRRLLQKMGKLSWTPTHAVVPRTSIDGSAPGAAPTLLLGYTCRS